MLAQPALADTSSPTGTGDAARNDGLDMTEAIRDSIVDSGAKNVILLIGDGMGDSEITVARNYEKGAGGEFEGLDALPLTGQYTTYSVNTDGSIQYVTDSAASGTGWSTGTKTYNGAIGVDVNGDAVNSLLEYAKANGKKTGNVSTAEIEDATPAAEIAHVTNRKCYGPEATSDVSDKRPRKWRGGFDRGATAGRARRRDTGGRGGDVRGDSHGRRVRGDDPVGAGRGARLPDGDHR